MSCWLAHGTQYQARHFRRIVHHRGAAAKQDGIDRLCLNFASSKNNVVGGQNGSCLRCDVNRSKSSRISSILLL